MQSDSIKIKFYFPNSSNSVKTRKNLTHSIIESMRKDNSLSYVGYRKENLFQKDLLGHIGNNQIDKYQSISIKQESSIKKQILSAVKKCQKILPHPDLPIFIFIYPWFPSSTDRILFEGITALSTYYTMHIFIDPRSFTKASLQKTIAHEWNHLVFYRYHLEQNYTLLNHIVMEGLAEIFREEIMGGKTAPWSLALNERETQKQFKLLRSKLTKRGMKIYKDVFFGNEKYKRWTGYSIGYRFTKEFREKNQKLSWLEIIKSQPENILELKKIEGHNGTHHYTPKEEGGG